MAISTYNDICNLAMDRLGAAQVSDVITSPSTPEEEACNRVYEQLRDELLVGSWGIEGIGDYSWNFAKRHLQLDLAKGYEASGGDDEIVTITGITTADPPVVTATAHGFLDGWLVHIYDVVGMTEINGRVVRVANKNDDDFECYGLKASSNNWTDYVSGGKAVRLEALAEYQLGYVHDVPADLLKPVGLEDGDAQFEIIGSGNSKRLLCLLPNPVLIYIAQVTTVTELPIAFVRAMAERIAFDLNAQLTKGNVGQEMLGSMYKMALRAAIDADARQGEVVMYDEQRMVNEGGFV